MLVEILFLIYSAIGAGSSKPENIEKRLSSMRNLIEIDFQKEIHS